MFTRFIRRMKSQQINNIRHTLKQKKLSYSIKLHETVYGFVLKYR